MDWTSPGFAGAVAALLTPLVVLIWQKVFPVSSFSQFDLIGREDLQRRNNWIDRTATFLMFAGLVSFVVPYAHGAQRNDPIGLALGFGLMMWLPASFVMTVTLPRGANRFREFLRWYELKWGIGIRGITYVYVPLFVLAALALVYVLQRYVV
jgi:hypothetical protein